jgi:hypothetical protein
MVYSQPRTEDLNRGFTDSFVTARRQAFSTIIGLFPGMLYADGMNNLLGPARTPFPSGMACSIGIFKK